MPFEFERQYIRDLILIVPKKFEDNRGFFMESYKKSEFEINGICDDFVQDNYSKSAYKVLRGLHYQAKPYQQAKLVRCCSGKILDIAIDLRENSDTFMQYIKVELSENNCNMLYIPQGFAHGFVTLSDSAQVAYKTTCEYSPISERGVIWNDNTLNIDWGIDFEPILSTKDKVLPKFNEIDLEEII